MSLVRAAVRISGILALRGATMVGDNVLDSQIFALQSNASGGLRLPEDDPFIAVYTDDATSKDVSAPLRAMVVNGVTSILFEAGIAATMTETDPETDESRIVGIGLPPTDGPMEFFLDMVMRQIGDTLVDPENVWAQIYMGFISRVIQVDRARAGSDQDGVRVAGQQLRVLAELLPDPIKGEALRPTSSMARFLALKDTVTQPEFRAQMEMIEAQLSGSDLPWHLIQRRYGLTGAEADALQVVSADPDGGDISVVSVEAAPAEQVQL
ncbi:hypothetical protein [Rhizobium leguminosarum]|uniref:hypothetical protein n=1 Tax=Rhizobium leguminosarum TaxID=384 RepID=UPI000B92B886|nr:hypothetical protein [Rhizobium leguminosarum]ASS56882.1 hypothetical protein CHR56_21285 [Rhizobium leguminosarum bv. viciae]